MANNENQITNGGNGATVRVQPLDNFLENAYRRYAVLTILDRALPDARDGLKPVQRRIMYSMYSTGMRFDSPYRKSARVVGDVLGKYHPHGDASVYDAMVRMAQDFSMRTPLVDGQGNFGSIDGDSAAAMRYTEARLSEIGQTMLSDIEKDTVNWSPNFDNSLEEPDVLPTRFPNLLINGVSGIAVGMSTNILPHNLGEVCEAIEYMATNWKNRDQISIQELEKFVPGPDLPTGGILYRYRVNNDGTNIDMIRQGYETGNATLVCQAKADIKEISGGKSEIIVTELPYQVQKSTILERIAKHRDKFMGLTDVRDESDFNGMKVVFEVARGSNPEQVLDRLLIHSQMRTSLSYNAMALIKSKESGQSMPSYLSLNKMLQEFIQHRLSVITRRSKFELDKAEARLHIVLGLLKALSMIDEVIDIIRRSQTPESARTNLMKKLGLSKIQAQAILDMPLRRLASLERKKLDDEKKELKTRVKYFKDILGSEKRRLDIVVEEINEIKDHYATPRRTIIVDAEEGHEAKVTVADLVLPTETQTVIVTTDSINRYDAKSYRDSTSSGKPTTRAVDIPVKKFTLEPSDTLFLVSSKGRLWQANIGRLPKDKKAFSEIGLEKNEVIIGGGIAQPDSYLVIGTSNGYIKRVSVEDCIENIAEASWSQIIGLSDKQDSALFASVASDKAHILIGAAGNKDNPPRILRFEASVVNPQATPSARGVTAIKMLGDPLIEGTIIEPDQFKNGYVVILTSNGHIKRVSLDEFPVQGRGGKGVLCWKPSTKIGQVISLGAGTKTSMVNIISQKGKRLKLLMKDIIIASRPTKGQDLCDKYGENERLFSNDDIQSLSIID